LGGSCNGRCWYIFTAGRSILRQCGIFCGHFVYFMVISLYGLCCTKKIWQPLNPLVFFDSPWKSVYPCLALRFNALLLLFADIFCDGFCCFCGSRTGQGSPSKDNYCFLKLNRHFRSFCTMMKIYTSCVIYHIYNVSRIFDEYIFTLAKPCWFLLDGT
jgi:hypothetical protein